MKKLGELDPRLHMSMERFFVFKEAREAVTARRDI